jgi:hypothetical protein
LFDFLEDVLFVYEVLDAMFLGVRCSLCEAFSWANRSLMRRTRLAAESPSPSISKQLHPRVSVEYITSLDQKEVSSVSDLTSLRDHCASVSVDLDLRCGELGRRAPALPLSEAKRTIRRRPEVEPLGFEQFGIQIILRDGKQ